jgi:glyoxylase-like metal-dependent hydrolase (beta-lactamase superfamily II)
MIRSTNYGPVTRFDLARNLPNSWRYWTTAYRVGNTLIDSGCAHCADELAQRLTANPDLAQIINTHTHEDHIGANGKLQRHYQDLKILAHPLALPVLEDPAGKQPLQPYRRIFWGLPCPSFGVSLTDGEIIENDDLSFQVIYTPGHSPDHLCLYEIKRNWLFSGDLFVGGKDHAIREGSDIWEIIRSLKLISTLPIKWLFPGSARTRENPQAEILAKIDYYEQLGEEIITCHERGWSESRMARMILGAPMRVERITLGHFSRRHLIRSYLGFYKS